MNVSCCFLYLICRSGYPPSREGLSSGLRRIRELGFTHVELEGVYRENLEDVFRWRHELKRECEGLGLDIVNFSPILPDLVSLVALARRDALDLYRRGVELAAFFGARTVQMDSYTPPLRYAGGTPYTGTIRYGTRYRVEADPEFRWDRVWDVLADSTRRCNDMARDAGLRLVMEPRVGEIVSNTDGLLRLMDAVADRNFGAILDTAHLYAQKEILVLSIEKMADRIHYLHVADNDGKENQHLAPGDGSIDWRGVFTALKKHRFSGYAAVDVGNVPDLDDAYRRSLRFLEDLGREVGI